MSNRRLRNSIREMDRRIVSYDNLKIFGSKIFVLDKDPTKDKLSARSHEGIFIGYSKETKRFRDSIEA